MEWELELEHLIALGLAGTCREMSRAVREAVLPNIANVANMVLLFLSTLLLNFALHAHVDGTSLLGLAAVVLIEVAILEMLLMCTAVYVFCVAFLYRTGGDFLAIDRVLTEGPPAFAFSRLAVTFLLVVLPFFVFFSSLFALAFFRLDIKIVLLRLLGWTSAASVAMVGQLACVVAALEDAALFSTVRRSLELLARKFWLAACILVTLDGCIVALMKDFPALVLDDALGLGLGLQVAAGVAIFVALCAVLVVALVAQTVVYLVCKSHHKVHKETSTATIKGVELHSSSLLTLVCYYC